jgi:hypothetical protein
MVLTESPAVSAGMPDGSEDGGSEAVNRTSELTDDVLHLVLPWLPAHEAVRTSALARRWRHLRRSARAVRITNRGEKTNRTLSSLTDFVSKLLLLRAAGSPIDELEIGCAPTAAMTTAAAATASTTTACGRSLPA